MRDAQKRDGESKVVCLVTLNGMRVDGEDAEDESVVSLESVVGCSVE